MCKKNQIYRTTKSTAVKSPVKRFKPLVTTTMATNNLDMYIKRCHFELRTRSHKNMTHYDVIIMKLRHFIDFWIFCAFYTLLHLITSPTISEHQIYTNTKLHQVHHHHQVYEKILNL